MLTSATIARRLAAAFLAGERTIDGVAARGAGLLGRRWRWLRPFAGRLVAAFAEPARPRQIAVVRFILADAGFRQACARHELELVAPILAPSPTPIPAARSWRLPAICTAGEFADWLQISAGDLEWFADRRCLEAKQAVSRLRNYRYRPLAKRYGCVRMIEAPKPRLKALQRRILAEIVARIPPHDAAHGFCPGRSIRSFAAPHVGRGVVLRIDLEDFFPSISAARVAAVFRTAGYSESVSDLLAGLCTNVTPADAWESAAADAVGRSLLLARWRYAAPHLPQGAPTSPALANLCAYRLDCRLTGLARAAGATYTRYADDLAFSGDGEFPRAVERFARHVCATALEEGFRVHHHKTRIMRPGVRQRLAGIVVNRRLNVLRVDYDRLKATLTNCLRHGPQSQNRAGHEDFRSHLQGKVAFVESLHPTRGRRLRALLQQIAWEAPDSP